MIKSRIARISEELAKQIEEAARKNRITFVGASKEISKVVKINKPKTRKIIREEIFEF